MRQLTKRLLFWNNEVKNLNDKGFNVEYKDEYEIEAFSDASADGYGGYVSLCAGALAEGTEVIQQKRRGSAKLHLERS